MSTTSDAVREQSACVLKLLSGLDRVVQATEDATPLGPYLVDALIDDAVHCPALGRQSGQRTESEVHLVTALHEAQTAAALVRACPSMERDWAIARLRSAVDQARRVLEIRTAAALAGCPDGDARSALESALKSERCATCPFA